MLAANHPLRRRGGCLIFSALFVLTFVLSLFIGSAHAQTRGK
jgi:hypothetical protein